MGPTPLIRPLNITRLPTTLRTRQPTPHKCQRRTPFPINSYRATRPAGQDIAVIGDAVEKQFDGLVAGDAADLVARMDSAALVGAGDCVAFDLVVEDGVGAGEAMGVAGYGEAAVVQAFGDLGVRELHGAGPWLSGSILGLGILSGFWGSQSAGGVLEIYREQARSHRECSHSGPIVIGIAVF